MKMQIDAWDLDNQNYSLPAQSATGHTKWINLRKGMIINWFDVQLHNPLIMDVGIHYPLLEISYTMSGKGYWEMSSQDFELSAGVSSLIYTREGKVHAELSNNEPMLHMELQIDLRYFNTTIPELDCLTANPIYCIQTAGSPQIALLIEQMKNCPYNGSLQKLYLEGKALELLAFHLDGTNLEEMKQQTINKLTAGDIQCLHQAKNILTQTWRQPPSLLALARLTGLNDYKLKLGFKELFGTTVFGYVRRLRMNEARSILEQGKANVSETASMVGYHNVSHFASLFRKTFGYNPSEVEKIIR